MNGSIPRILAVCGPDRPELSGRAGGRPPLELLCKAFGFRAATYPVGSLIELTRTIGFIGNVAHLPGCEGTPLIVHVGIDGDSRGMRVGPDKAAWGRLNPMIAQLFADLESYAGPFVLVLAAAGASDTDLAGALDRHRESAAGHPRHLFATVASNSSRDDAMLAWSLFYAEARRIDFSARSLKDLPNLQRLQLRLQRLGLAIPSYYNDATAGPSACVPVGDAGRP